MTAEIQILLATYNGERYLVQQMESILRQTNTDWEILARDDGSTDQTRDILDAYEKAHPDRIRIIRDGDSNLGCGQNFARLMEHSTAPYISFADQDDVWHPNKLESGLARLKHLELKHGEHTPLMTHHDFAVINADGLQTSPSYEGKFKTGKHNSNIAHMLVQPVVHGFASMGNRALIDKTMPIPKEESFHDIYLSMVASVFGHLDFDPRQHADYRIHGKNVTAGNNPFYSMRQKGLLKTLFSTHAVDDLSNLFHAARAKQVEKSAGAARFFERFGPQMTPDQHDLFSDFSTMPEASKVTRAARILHHGFLPESRTLKAMYVTLG